MLINFSILAKNTSSADIKHSLASINKNATPRKGECHFIIKNFKKCNKNHLSKINKNSCRYNIPISV